MIVSAEHPARHLELVAIEVAELAGELVRSVVGAAATAGTKSSPTDVVTETDVRSEALIRRELRERCPGSAIVGEELADDAGSNTVGWIVDPIDGTVNFLYDLPVVSVSIAATMGGRTVAGAVCDVVRAETFSASIGRGARRNGVGVHATEPTGLDQALVATGFAYDAERRREQTGIFTRLIPRCRDIRCMGSAALNLCWVGCGRLDGYYEQHTKLYDYAAGALIAAEGGALTEVPAENQLDLMLAAPASIFSSLRETITLQ